MRLIDADALKAEARKYGYRLQRIPPYQCSCYMPYPNENHKNKNGKWKCVDKYEPIKLKQSNRYGSTTHCRLRGKNNETD